MSVGSSHCLAPCEGKRGFRTSAYLQDLACYVGQSVPFDEGSEILAKIGGINLTDKQIERISHHYGEALEELEEEEAVVQDDRQHYAMMDGSMVYIRGEEEGWKEL